MSNKFRRVLIDLIKKTIPPNISGKIKSVDEEHYTCVVTPYDGGADYNEVRLKANIDEEDHGLICIPEEDSDVLISPLFHNEHVYFVSRFSKVKYWQLKTVSGITLVFDGKGNIQINSEESGASLVFNDEGVIEINGKDLGGLVKAQALVEKMNVIENDLNNFKAVVGAISAANTTNPATPVTVGVLYGFFSLAEYLPLPLIKLTSKEEIESIKVKHG